MKARNMESLKDKFKNVIVKTPASSMVDGITSAPELGKPIYELALEQHAKYVEALKSCGVNVTICPKNKNSQIHVLLKILPLL